MTHIDPKMHTPTAEFRDFLESEVVREYRRNRTFRRLRAAAVIIVSAGIGMSATLASAQVRVASQRDSLQEATKAEAMLAMVRLELAKAQLNEEQKRVSAGVRSSASLTTTQLDLRVAEEEVARVVLNGREIEVSGLPPRDELNAPLVKGEDFVKERLQNQLMTANRKLQAAEQDQTEIGRRAAVGAATDLELSDANMTLLRARSDLAVLAARIQAREVFLSKGTSVDELLKRIERTESQHGVGLAQAGLQLAQARLDLAEKRQKVGAAGDVDVLRARLDVKEREVELQRAVERLKRIK